MNTAEIQPEESITVTENVPNTVPTNDAEMEVNAFAETIDEMQNQVDVFVKDLKIMSNELKNTKKKFQRIVKSLSKSKKRKHQNNSDESTVTKKEPSGFISPIEISDELADFLKLEHKTKLPRTVVTKHIITFIKENHLESTVN